MTGLWPIQSAGIGHSLPAWLTALKHADLLGIDTVLLLQLFFWQYVLALLIVPERIKMYGILYLHSSH